MRYDAAIIGTGPGGVSAAITLKIRNKNVILLGSGALSAKMTRAEKILNYPGLPGISGQELAERMRAHLDSLDIRVTEERIGTVYAMGSYFALQGKDMIEATTVILATGVFQGKTLPGEDALVGRGVSYCATCDAALYRGREVAVVGYSPSQEEEADFLSEVAARVDYFPMYKQAPALRESVNVRNETVTGIERRDGRVLIKTNAGEYAYDGSFVLRDAVGPDRLVPGLEMDGSHVKVSPDMATNLPGLFACGDVTGRPYQYIRAAGQGNVAALSAVKYLDELRKA